VSVYTAPGRLLRTLQLPEQEQGESMTYSPDGRTLLVGSEFPDQPVWRVPLPKEAQPPRSPASAPPSGQAVGGGATGAPGGPHSPGRKAAAILVVAGVVAALVVSYLRRRSA
jgi:hypothetical protein